MDIMTILGWVFGAILMVIGIILNKSLDGVYTIVLSKLPGFFDPTSIFIVVGGTIAALMVSFPASSFKQIPKHMKIVLFPTKYNPIKYIDQLVEFAKEARINGLLALESKLKDVEDDFLKSSLLMVVDAVDSEKVKQLLEAKMDYLDERHCQGISFYEKAANFGPAFGMIGTLIGLVNLLSDLSSPDTIGPSMAVALITTFYGTVLSNLVFGPISTKLKVRHDEEFLCKMIICEGVQAIQAGDNPKFIHEKLYQLLPNNIAMSQVKNADDDGDSKPGKKGKKIKR
ncbi:MAG: MotA/TolQ/ExbB proton channel family protein [Oscillospiraceae bacterium]